MGFIESLRLAFTALAANKMRSLLTMLGIIIGISAVITITTIGNSIQQTLSNTFNQFGVNYFYLQIMQDYAAMYSNEEDEEIDDNAYVLEDEDMMTDEMFERLFQTYPGVFQMADATSCGKAEIVNSKNEYINLSIIGATDGYMALVKMDLLRGRNVSFRDSTEKKHSAVISDIFERQYFPDGTDALGKSISITLQDGSTQDFTIVGVYEYSEKKLGKFEPGTKEIDKMTPILIPYKTAMEINGEEENYYYSTSLMYDTAYSSAEAHQMVSDFFEEEYKNNKYWTVYIENESDIVKSIDTVVNIITIAISVIAAISLIVGGVGVMNIMLVSIVERTREIGIRKALGAQNTSIRMQFVVEAIIICLIGGIIGIILGVLNGVIIGEVAKYLVETMKQEVEDIIEISVSPSLSAIAVAVIFSMLTGVFFGFYPANKAAKMNPIDALRYE